MYRDSRWQKKRLEIMERDEWKCRSCGKGKDDEILLNVHHSYYEKGKSPWEYGNHTLVTWCEKCHTRRHNMLKDIQLYFANASGHVAGGLWMLTQFDYRKTLVEIEPIITDDVLSTIVSTLVAELCRVFEGE